MTTLQIVMGATSRYVMTMDVYSHVLPDMQEAAADKLERLLFGA